MPVRINLKELFGSDSQEITVNKLNFNFNKLLELGVGLKGAKGITGNPGALGPSGPQGIKGDKGNQWYVGNGDPNTQTFPGILDGDFYVNSNESQIWQYDLSTDSWSVVVDLENIVVNYLTAQGTTFVRGLGTGSPDDSRFIVFPNRGNTISARLGDQLGSNVDNDVLFLSNFNEKFDSVWNISNFPSDTNDLFNALQSMYIDTINPAINRYHLDMGSLYNDGVNDILSELNRNFKFKHDVVSIGSPVYAGNNFLYKGIISMSNPEDYTIGEISHAGIVEFQMPKRDPNSPGSSENILFQIGSRFSLGEESSYVLHDGINIKSGVYAGGIGLATNFDNSLAEIDGNTYFVLDTGGNVDAILLNTEVFQDGGNIRQLGTSKFRDVDSQTSTSFINPSIHTLGMGSIFVLGNTVYTSDGYGHTASQITFPAGHSVQSGIFSRWDITDKNNTVLIQSEFINSISKSLTDSIQGIGICDIEAFGDYAIIANNLPAGQYTEAVSGGNTYQIFGIQIVRVKSNESLELVSRIGTGNAINGLYIDLSSGVFDPNWQAIDGAWRVKVSGNYAFVSTNKLRQFGSSDVSNWRSHWGTTNSYTYADLSTGYEFKQELGKGHISVIDLSDISNPKVVKTYDEQSTHHLDMAVNEDFIATVSLVVGNPISTTHFDGYKVKLSTYNLSYYNSDNSSLSDISAGGSYELFNYAYNGGTNPINEANSQNNSVINKFATVQINGRNIYAIYKNNCYIFSKYESGNGTSGFELKSSFAFDPDPNTRAISSKIVGRSLYVLVSQGGSGSYDSVDSHIIKLNIESESGNQKVWKKSLGAANYSDIDIIGNNLYVYGSGNSGSELKILEIDGFETEAANIGILKTLNANITGNAHIGGLSVRNGIKIGANGIISDGGIHTQGSMSNDSKIWYRGSVSVRNAGAANGKLVYLNNSHEHILNQKWSYRISCAGSTNNTGAAYLVFYDSDISEWIVRTISQGNSSNIPKIQIGEYGAESATPTQVWIYKDTSGTQQFKYTIEATYVGSLHGNISYAGNDGHWMRINNDLEYWDGDINIRDTSLKYINTSLGGYAGWTYPITSPPNVIWNLPNSAGTIGQSLVRGAGNTTEWSNSAGGWTDGGTVVYLTTPTDTVSIGGTSVTSGYKVQIDGGTNAGLLITGNTPGIQQGLRLHDLNSNASEGLSIDWTHALSGAWTNASIVSTKVLNGGNLSFRTSASDTSNAVSRMTISEYGKVLISSADVNSDFITEIGNSHANGHGLYVYANNTILYCDGPSGDVFKVNELDIVSYALHNVKNELRISNSTNNAYSGFISSTSAPNYTYTLPDTSGNIGQILAKGSGAQLVWQDSPMYETLDGNNVMAEANYAYDVLIRNSDNTGYEWIPIGTLWGVLEQIEENYGESGPNSSSYSKWNLSYNSSSLDISIGTVTWNGASVGQGNNSSNAAGFPYLNLAAGANRGTAINFKIPDGHNINNMINIDVTTILGAGTIIIGYHVGNSIPSDSAFSYSSHTVSSTATLLDTIRQQIIGSPGDTVMLRIYKPASSPQIGISSIDISVS